MPSPIRMALQIPNFTYPNTPPSALFERIAATAREAESTGFDAVLVMDHFYQLPMLGPTDHEMLEAYPLLGALAAQTQQVRLGTLVSGNTYRNPAHLAKIVTTLDVVSRGRAILGIGAGWFEPEHQGYGFDFPPIGERLSRLDEALQIIRAMLRGERPTFAGRFYHTHEALNVPAPVRPGGPAVLDRRHRRAAHAAARRASRGREQLDLPARGIPAQARGAREALRVGRAQAQ